jgi:NAD(P)-dependent dehydrogenase (short-subunit alcohol dehydrogenase family)
MATNLNATIALCKVFHRWARRRSLIAPGKVKASSSVELGSGLEEAKNQNSAGRSLGSHPPDMETRGSPCIINVSSLLGLKGGLGATSYAASKAGVLGFTRALVCEYGRSGISTRVNAIVPGYIDTPMIKGEYKDQAPLCSCPIYPSFFSCCCQILPITTSLLLSPNKLPRLSFTCCIQPSMFKIIRGRVYLPSTLNVISFCSYSTSRIPQFRCFSSYPD